MTNNTDKKFAIAQAARILAIQLQNGLKPRFGYEGVTLHRDGTPGDILGHIIVNSGVAPRVQVDETEPKVVLALALGTTIYNLPESLQTVVNELVMTADDRKRAYRRRVPRLVKLLHDLASELTAGIPGVTPAPTVTMPVFNLPGKSI